MTEVRHPLVMKIKCTCGKEVCLKLVGGQYQTSWIGKCECGCVWSLEELSETLEELNIESEELPAVLEDAGD
ncbi:MAG: hypothetical protein J7J01_01270 [Methanophagales archaeon]|nr:hypothetical protein [Methanophagales archaeon]